VGKEVLARKKRPRPFNPRISKIGLARMLVHEVVKHRLKLRKKEYRTMLLSRPCIYGTFSGRFGGFHPIKDKCTGCMRCVQEYPGICTVDRNPDFFKFADSYWVPEESAISSGSPVATVSYEATTGEIPIKGMGYKGSFAGKGWDSIWTDMSEIVRPTRDGVYGREYISTLVDIGSKRKFLELNGGEIAHYSRTIEAPIPIIFDYLPPNLTTQSITSSIAQACENVGTYFVASPEQAERLPETLTKRMIPLVSSRTIEQNRAYIIDAPAIQLSTPDVAALREVREINPSAPVIARLPFTKDSDRNAVDLVRAGVDAIHLLANYHGEEWDSPHPRFIRDLLRTIHTTLVRESLRDEVTLIGSGGITLAEHVPKAIACGADLVALDTTVLVALQAEFQEECVSSAEGRIKPEEFDVKWGEQRIVNLLASWHDQLIEILSAMGMRDVRRLRGDVGRVMFNEDFEKEAFADITRGT
jgi:hypothetical protein